jgi:hypothetical protein
VRAIDYFNAMKRSTNCAERVHHTSRVRNDAAAPSASSTNTRAIVGVRRGEQVTMPTEIRSDDAALRPSRLNAICDPFWIRGPKDGCFAFQLFEDYGSTNSHNLLYHGTTQCRVVPL